MNRIALSALLAAAAALSASGALPLQTFSNVVLVADHPANDGDSFIVSVGGVRHHLRLYYADCPESVATQDADFKRVREQRRYFGLTNEAQVIAFGKAAKAFTKKALAEPFTVHTAFASALGRSDDKRYYAFIRSRDGRDLAEVLVREGLARAYGSGRETPEGVSQEETRAWLADLEAGAMLNRRGAWAQSDHDRLAAMRAETRREERELQAVKEAVKGPPAASGGAPIRLNKASREEIEALPGISPSIAKLIYEGRPWKNWEALDAIPGVGPATLAKLRAAAVLE